MPTDFDEADLDPNTEIEFFLSICARQIVKLADSERFLDWIGEYGADLLPALAAQIDPRMRTPRQVFRALGREIWAGTPLPHRRFAQEKLPTPGRNDPCHCGSGQKFKQCCGQWDAAEMGMPPMNLLPHVLQALPKKRWAELAGSRVSIDAVGAAAFQFLNDDNPEDAIKLLTPWFPAEGRWPDRLADMFDLLLDAYEATGKRKKRKDMATAATLHGEPQVAAVGWQRLAAMLSDEGDYDGAWAAFGHAQRADPDSVPLGMLELTILLSQKKWDQASQRARFWAARLAKQHGDDVAETLEYFNMVARDPQGAMQQVSGEMLPPLKQLSALLDAAPAPACAFRLKPDAESAGVLDPSKELRKVREQWRQNFPSDPPFSVAMTTANGAAWEWADRWLPVLEAHPILWQDFDVLDDLVCAIDGLGALGLEKIIHALTSRALVLLDGVLAAQKASGRKLEWGFMQNRPALRLVVRHILECMDAGEQTEAMQWTERMVNELNPNDNHGLRDRLMKHYLASGENERAVALGDRYPDDFASMRYNRALAYYRTGQKAKADKMLAEVLTEYPLVGKGLLSKRVAKPKEGPIALGSVQEANHYCAECRFLWTDDALAWLAAMRQSLSS